MCISVVCGPGPGLPAFSIVAAPALLEEGR